MQKIKLIKEPNINAKYDAFPYQSDAVKAIRDLPYSAIFHEQGLGKTKIAIDLMLYWIKEKHVDTVLYVAKKGLIQNWLNELTNHTYMKPRVLEQNSTKNYYTFNSPSRLLLTHYEVILSEKERLKLFLKTRNVAIIIDEASKIKNPESNLAKAFFEISPYFKKKVIMTGTPVANRPYDIWSQIYFLDQGNSLGKEFSTFKRETNLDNKLPDNAKKRKTFEEKVSNIYAKISDFSVRETKESGILNLPAKEILKIYTDWEFHQFDLYRTVQKELRAYITKDGALEIDDSSETMKRLLRLVQIASNPSLVDDNYKSKPGKFETLSNIVYKIVNNGEKCIIWSNFIKNVEWLKKEFIEYNSVMIHGKLSMVERNKSVKLFTKDPNVCVLIATPASAKEGLTLTTANHAIFYDRSFSLDDYLQAQDRIHRISQKRKCYIYNLIMKDSIDEWVDVLIQSKHLAAQLAQGDITMEYYKSQMTYDYGKIISEILCSEDMKNE